MRLVHVQHVEGTRGTHSLNTHAVHISFNI